MKALALPLILLLFSAFAAGQTATFTTSNDTNCQKDTLWCIDYTNPDGYINPDNRGDHGNLTISSSEFTGTAYSGTYSGFTANPNGTRAQFDGVGSYTGAGAVNGVSFQLNGTFPYHAYYVGTCSGRGCGGTLGWHYILKAGSTVTLNQ
jgi:hypothetical protein